MGFLNLWELINHTVKYSSKRLSLQSLAGPKKDPPRLVSSSMGIGRYGLYLAPSSGGLGYVKAMYMSTCQRPGDIIRQ